MSMLRLRPRNGQPNTKSTENCNIAAHQHTGEQQREERRMNEREEKTHTKQNLCMYRFCVSRACADLLNTSKSHNNRDQILNNIGVSWEKILHTHKTEPKSMFLLRIQLCFRSHWACALSHSLYLGACEKIEIVRAVTLFTGFIVIISRTQYTYTVFIVPFF